MKQCALPVRYKVMMKMKEKPMTSTKVESKTGNKIRVILGLIENSRVKKNCRYRIKEAKDMLNMMTCKGPKQHMSKLIMKLQNIKINKINKYKITMKVPSINLDNNS